MKSGVYRIKNIITGECYVGSSIDIEKRLKEHQYDLKVNRHCNPIMQNSYNKYGFDAFVYNVLDYCENILEREQMFIDSGAFKFNICLSAAAPMSGRKHSDETKLLMSSKRKGKPAKNKGSILSAEAKAKMSAAKKGKSSNRLGVKVSAEARAKMSAAAKEAWARKKTSNNNKEEIIL